ncbi:3-dehydro-L-gulonate 2-dehydrogenase [Paenibacillus koleovorans]|uniref:3-dehydro-L-gulonate 2-dehydrogenase n=1 Tax=Paenibacillus koleovorans TaxID=121608 RepID=UPI0015806B09|nr:3-dehydro-L-gulonate 2-dehydrogenase [Paenibacillus koleovorans]
MLRIPFEDVKHRLETVLLQEGFTPERAARCALMFTQTSCDGVYSHGLNRFPAFVGFIRKGIIEVNAEPVLTDALGAIERWDGQCGPGNLNATFAMDRAIALSKQYGLGAVALRRTNHWMRAGTYGWQAAEAGCIGICWTNTMPNMPPWGGRESKLGNNPLVLAVPREEGPVVLDIAMTQYSYGKLSTYVLSGDSLPYDGGYDEDGQLTRDPAAIAKSRRPLPIGYWKGSGLALMLDLIAVMLSGGLSTQDIGKLENEHSVSQIFLAFDYEKLPEHSALQQRVNGILNDMKSSLPIEESGRIRYPGESILTTRETNRRLGIPVDETIWDKIAAL